VSLRLATFNLCSGRSVYDGRIVPERLAEAVRALGADVLAVQEVDHAQERSAGLDQAAVVAEAAGATTYRFVPLVAGTPGLPGWTPADRDAWTPGRPHYGIALVSRRPVVAWHELHLAPPRGRWPIVVPSRPPQLLWICDEPRAVLAAELADPPMVVASTHLSFVPGVNVRQLWTARRWLTGLAGPDRPVLLLGDLNLPGRLPARITGWTPLVTGPTFPAPNPKVQLDHVLAAPGRGGAPLRAAGQVRQGLGVGDHRAAVVDVEL
jgi:endonuclease/exonuclease/phosphatase family metal-dependent hydrolase